MYRLWALGGFLVLITGIGRVQGGKAPLEINSMAIDTVKLEVLVCFTYNGTTETITATDIKLECWISKTDPNQVTLETKNCKEIETHHFCSTHTLINDKSAYGSDIDCMMNIINSDISEPISGSAEFAMPEEAEFPTCTEAYRWPGKNLVGIICSTFGTFKNAIFDSQPFVSVTTSSTGVNYIRYQSDDGDKFSTVSLCTTKVNAALDSPGKLDICIPKINLSDANKGLTISASQLIYDDSGATLSVEVASESTSIDLVLITDSEITTVTFDGSTQPISTVISPYLKGSGSEFLVFAYSIDPVDSVLGSITDYDLTLTALTSYTLELSWENIDSSVNIFTIERDNIGGTATSFTKATVKCSDPDRCYGYFVDLTPGASYTCSVSNDGKLNKITGTPATMPAVTKDFSVKQLSLIWNNEVNAAAATVCVEQMNAAMSAKEASYHELIMINSQGQVLKTRQMVQKTENFLCFEGVHLETSTFDISHGKVTLVVVKRSADEHTILALGQTELLFISPEMGRVGQMGHVSWKNPEGYSFTARRGRQPAPLSTSNNGSLVHYFIPKTTGLKDVLVVETEAVDVRMTAVIPLIPHVTSVEKQDGSVSRRNPGTHTFATKREPHRNPIATSFTCHNCTDNIITQEVKKNMTSRQDSAITVIGKSSLNSKFNDLPGLTINYMTFPITKSSVRNSVNTLVDVECAEDMADADSLTLTFIILEGGDTSRQYVDVADVAGIYKVPKEVNFPNMDDTAFLPGDVTVEVVGRAKTLPIAYGQAQITLRAPEDTALRVGKQTDGNYEAFRISFSGSEDDTSGAQLDYDSSCDCPSSPCYCLDTVRVTQEPQPFCLKLKNTASTTGETILQCDDQLTASDVDNEAKVTSAKMTHKTSETVDVAVGVNFDGQAELLFYETGDTTLIKPSQTCSGPGSLCTITDQPANSATGDYSILAVTIDGSGDVKESILLAFEDYKTKFTQLTSDAMEVRFSAKTKTLYQVTVTPSGEAYDTTTIECGAEDNNICTVYFISMTAGNYEASVQLRDNGEMNQVATQLIMGTTETKGQKGSVAPVNRQNPRDPILTGNLTTLASETNLGSRLPQLTHNSANKVDARTPFSASFNELPELTVKYMTFPITKTSSGVDVPTLVDVEGADGTNANSLTLAFIVADGASATRQYVDVTDLAASTEVTFAHMNDNALVPGAVTVVVAGHNGEVPVAYGQAQVTLTDPGSKAWRVGKQTDGSHEAFRLTFGKTENDDGAQLDYDSSCDCPTSPCYCLGTARVTQEPQPFCLKLKTTASTTGGIILQCDNQLTASDAVNEAKVTSAKMTHKTSGTVDVAVDVNFDGQLELLFYETGDTTLIKPSQTCSVPGSLCTITDQPANSATGDYSILAVTIDGSDDVKESSLLAFEDYKTQVTQLTSDAMEVRFSAKTKTLYQVTVTPSSGAYDTTTIECGAEDNNICTVYFISMTAGNYEASVQLRDNGEMNQVATQLIMGTTETKGQKGSVAPVNRQNPRDPILTGNLTTLASETNLGSRLPQLTHNSANKVDARTPFSASFNELPELTVKYMTFPITKTSSGVDVPTLVDVEGADGTNANSLTLAFIVADDASATRQYVDVTDLAASTEVTFAHMNDNALVPGAVTVVVAGHNGEVPVAYGQAQVTLTDPGSKAWRVGKQTDGSHEAFRLTFGKTENDDGAQLDYDSSCDCPNSPCYCLGTARVAQEPQPFCLKLKITASTTGEIIFQCDNQLTASDAVNEAKVTSAKMTHKTSETVDVAVGVNFDGQAELLFYETGDTTLIKPSQTCSGPGSLCTITDQPANSATGDYSILAVTIDGSGDVKESILLAFEDYKTKVTQLTSDAIEVRFSAKTKTLYQVSVTPDGGAYDTTTIECGAEDNNLCTVYFIAMTARNDYEATVQLRTSGELNQVATQFVMETREKISRNATLAFRAKGSERLLDLCVGDQLPSTSGDYILVLIAGLNNTVITKGPLSNENPCFYDVSVDVQPSQHVNIMVLTDEENTRVVMETDVFILDQTSADISVTQVGSKALKATWSNRYLFDLEYEVGLDGVGHTVACKAQQECIEYIHLNSSQGNTNVTIKENNDGTVQVVSVEVSPVTIPELTIASRSIQWDDRLRVCFDRLATADAYELGLEKDDTHLQTNVHAQVDTHATSETCIVSADTVDVGAYVDLWMVVTAFEASGTILASGESTWNTILLSSSRNVRAAIQNTTILASWYLLDDTSTIDNFQVILRSSDGDTVMLASNTQSAYTFTSQSYGTYTVCVKALKVVTTESTVDSEEVCSDIIVFSSNAGPTQNVHETEPKSTAKDSVLLTWQPPQGEENVSGYYVSWSNVNPSSKRSPRRRLPPQSLMRSHEELQQWVSGEGDADFVIVPATETSVEVKDLQEDAKYTFCVSSIVNDVMAQSPACSNTSLADFTPLSPPSLLNPSGGELQWTDNNTGDITYMVEWRSPSEDDHLEVSETSYHLQVAPGKWDVSVRALSADSCSDPNTTTVTIPGVPTSILQVGSKKMTVAWYEEPTPQDNNRYIVDIFQDTQPVDQCTLGCSGDASKGDCSCEFSLETIQPPVVLTVSVHMYSQESYDLNFTMMQISGMRPVATTIRSSSDVDVKWEAVENAKFYQLSLYENESLSVVRWAKQQALPLWVTLTEEDMMGNVFVVQACTDESHCGDATQMTILDQNTSGGSSVVGAVLGGVLGVTILACVIFFFVKRQQVKKKERKALNDQEMAPAEYIYDEWGARRLGQAPVATTLSNTS